MSNLLSQRILLNRQSKFLIVFVMLFIVITTNAFAETWKRGTPQEVKRGKVLYVEHCQSCHGVKGVGGQPVNSMLRNPNWIVPPALDDSQHAWHHTDEALITTILEGSPRTKEMPAWNSILSKRDVADLVAYIKSLWSDRALSCQGPRHMSCMR